MSGESTDPGARDEWGEYDPGARDEWGEYGPWSPCDIKLGPLLWPAYM